MDMIYVVAKAITFPGAEFKAVIEHLVYRMFKIPIEDSRHFRANEMFGHIEHELTHGPKSFIICFLPSVISFILGLLMLIEPSVRIFYFGSFDIMSFIYLYFGVSFLTNIFPLREDSLAMWESLYNGDGKSSASKIFLFIPALSLRVFSILEHTGITLLTSLGFAVILPFIIARFLG
ncbi:MAG: hypothetical protein LBH71_04625 [Oscillospiraceae bacterium]|jgi:hypothetical protein|nr:hypothetical protein [Oscillospiraceae bacterium]